MASVKRKGDKNGSDWEEWEEGSAKKRPKTINGSAGCELRDNPDNYGTAASQRPRRSGRRQTSVIATVRQAPKKVKPKQNQAASKSKHEDAPQESMTESHAAARQIISYESQSEAELSTGDAEPSAQAPEKRSRTVTLKVRLNRQQSKGLHNDKKIECEDSPETQPASLQTQALNPSPENTEIAFPQDQYAQQIQAPVPVSGQGITSPNLSQVERGISQEPWVPRTPGDSPGQTNASRDPFETPQWLLSETVQSSCMPPTPESIPRRNLSSTSNDFGDRSKSPQLSDHTQPTILLHPPWNAPPLVALAAPQDISDTKSYATTEYEDAPEHSPDTSSIGQQLHALAQQLFVQRDPGQPKPEPEGQPEVWADGRQELCETLHFYRSYQGACYSTGGFARGFMFDKVAHARDYTDSNVVISRAGGGLTKDKDSGEMKVGRDQVEDTVAQGLRNCISHRSPMVVVTGIDNPHIPSKPPHQYCVLDYFKPTHIWVEKSGNSKIVRYRFEKLNAKKGSWWQPKNTRDPVELGSLPPPVCDTCNICGNQSPQIYLNGWMCLQPTCIAFWNIVTSDAVPYEPEEASLIYDPRFLKQRTPWQNDDHDYPLIPNDAKISSYAIPGEDTSQAFWLGMVCPECGRCISRLSWMGWQCQNSACTFTKEPPHTLIPAMSLREPFWPLTNSYMFSRDIQSSLIDVRVTFAHGYRINRFTVPGIDGFITHMIANKSVVEEPGGPDAMFEELQQTDIGLRRRSMPNGQLKGPNYCRHFAVNYGMPYKFIAATASHPFDGAARPITATRSRLNWAAKLLLSLEPGRSMDEASEAWKEQEFNEVLALGYFEQQKINYHDDGEFGLGPTIATLSLGAPGTMRIRMKARHYHGVSSAGVYDDAPPLPGCRQHDARLALLPELEAMKRSDPKAYTARRKEIVKELKLKSSGNAKEVLNMQLGHGDIVVMYGAELQRYYEHSVEHAGKLRFALTCRYIDPGSLKEEDRPDYEVGPDTEGYDGSSLG